jgi:hypothetical protein
MAASLTDERPIQSGEGGPGRHGWVLVATSVVSLAAMAMSRGSDFQVYWRAGQALLGDGWTGVYRVSDLAPFKYHPFFALIFAPFALLPETAARIVWAGLNGAALFDAQRRWSATWRLDPVAIGLGFVAVSQALTWQYKFGNVTFLMLWLWTVALTTERRWLEATGYAVLIALKPFWLALLAPWALERRVGLIGRVTVTLAVISLVPILVGVTGGQPLTGYDRWLATFADPLHDHNYPKTDNQSWYGFLSRFPEVVGDRLPLWWLAGSAVVGLLWLWQWRRRYFIRGRGPGPSAVATEAGRRNRPWLELSVAPFILWTAPLSWIHHQILLWPLLARAWQVGRSERRAKWAFVAVVVLISLLSEAIVGRPAKQTLFRWGVPLLAFPLLAWWSGRAADRVGEDRASVT